MASLPVLALLAVFLFGCVAAKPFGELKLTLSCLKRWVGGSEWETIQLLFRVPAFGFDTIWNLSWGGRKLPRGENHQTLTRGREAFLKRNPHQFVLADLESNSGCKGDGKWVGWENNVFVLGEGAG